MAVLLEHVGFISFCVALAGLLQIHEVNGIECGTVATTNSLIHPGNKTIEGAWPFAVAIYERNHSSLLCGGTLISKKHVLTAANCIQSKTDLTSYAPSDLIVYLGAYNLAARNEEGVIQSNILQFFFHPEWKWKRFLPQYVFDIAILLLSHNVAFTDNIRPVCIPAAATDINSATIDIKGTVVGWGSTESGNHEDIQRQASVKALNDTYCYSDDRSIVYFSSNHTFCGGFIDGYLGFGDSGGGFYVKLDDIWVQYGIILALRANETGQIIPNSVVLYTNVKIFKNWIEEVVTQTEDKVGEA